MVADILCRGEKAGEELSEHVHTMWRGAGVLLSREGSEPLTGALFRASSFPLIPHIGVPCRISFGGRHPYPEAKYLTLEGF